MAPYTNHETLGSKHKQYNKITQDAIANGKLLGEKEFTKSKNDLENLQKIDIASHNKNIEYILSVLKSDDMLYVSRALKQSEWLVDDQYAYIINPNYLNEHLFPYMKTKAAIKLLKHIRQHLKSENRVEEFYKIESNPKAAAKWLSRCSVPFIIENISKYERHLSDLEYTRVYARSVTIFESNVKNKNCSINMKAASFLLRTHTHTYLDAFEQTENWSCGRMQFGPTATDLLMKKASDRVINNFLKYVNFIHIPTFINNIKREEVKGFLMQIVNAEDQRNCLYKLYRFNIIVQFLERMPKEEQFQFVKKVFLNRENILAIPDDTLERGTEMFAFKKLCNQITIATYHWYMFAPFDIAFEEIKKLIEAESNNHDKHDMFSVLQKCAKKNTKDLLTLLTYYSKIFLKKVVATKKKSIIGILQDAEIYKADELTWNAFMDVIKNLNDTELTESHKFNEIILLHDVLLDKPVTEAVEKQFSFHTFEEYRKTLNLDAQNKVFKYLYNYLVQEAQRRIIKNKEKFKEAVATVHNFLNLFIDWEKELTDFQFVLDKIKELIRLRNENAWNVDLSTLYNRKKSWRRLMFEESIVLHPSQKVCINALKHDPGLLARYASDVEAISCNDAVSLKHFLRKIRMYWPDTLADAWSTLYLGRLDTLGGHKALSQGICTLLSHEQVMDILKKFAPAMPRIDWNNTNELTLSLQRFFAKNMHIARPQPPAGAILMYAKGDFLQYALPSLLAIYYNMGRIESQEHIPKLLSAPVSLQKHGLRFAFKKLEHKELKQHLTNVWQATKNISIRAVTFELLFDFMCKQKDEDKAKELWLILDVFIENLSFKEDKKIYAKLEKIENVPQSIKPKFLVKSYVFLKSLLPHIKIDVHIYENSVQQLALYTRNIMEAMDPEFVENLILTEFIDASFFTENIEHNNMLGVTTSFLLCVKDEEEQSKKYEKILVPLISRALSEWNQEDKYFIKNNLQGLLTTLYNDLFEYVIKNKMLVPTKMFQRIEKELKTLALPPNYLIIRTWELIVKLTEIIGKVEAREDWKQLGPEIVSDFGKFCLEVLREDVKVNFPCIYVLFTKVLKNIVRNNLPEDICVGIYEVLLSDNDFIQAYLLVLQMLNPIGYYCNRSEECDAKEKELKKRIREHPSVEVRMHYYSKYNDDKEALGI